MTQIFSPNLNRWFVDSIGVAPVNGENDYTTYNTYTNKQIKDHLKGVFVNGIDFASSVAIIAYKPVDNHYIKIFYTGQLPVLHPGLLINVVNSELPTNLRIQYFGSTFVMVKTEYPHNLPLQYTEFQVSHSLKMSPLGWLLDLETNSKITFKTDTTTGAAECAVLFTVVSSSYGFNIAVGCGRYTEMVNNDIRLYSSDGSTSAIRYTYFDFQNTIQGNRIPTFIGNKHGFWILTTRYYGKFNYYGEVRRVLSSSAKMISMGALINDDYASLNWGGVAGVAAINNESAGIIRISSRTTTATAAFVDYGYFLRDKQTNIPIESNFNDYIIIENKNGIFVPTSGAIVPGVGYCMYKSGVTIQPHIIKSPFADEFLFVMNSSSGLFYFNLSDWDVSTPYVQQELITHAIT
jgi:hypothetical protein